MAYRYLVTAALPYSNGRLHVGHVAGVYLPADTYVRYLRARGEEVRFVCGSDDNGVTALIAAEKEGLSVAELTRRYHVRQAADFSGLGVEFDVYGGTHQPAFVELHERLSQSMFQKIHQNGYFSKKSNLQLYDAESGRFLPDRYVKGNCYHTLPDGRQCAYDQAYGDQCEACGNAIDPMQLIDPVSTLTGTRPEPRETTHWHLQLQRLENRIRQWLLTKSAVDGDSPAWREFVLKFALGQVKQGLPERAMTRDLEWGVPVPLDDPDAAGKSLYVWFDAPIGYVSFTAKLCQERDGDWQQYERWWKDPQCRIVHFVGEDNTIFHTLTWPAMLMAEGTYQLPWQVVVNAFLNVGLPDRDEEKLSKSRGTAIWIEDYLQRFDPDPLRYYLTCIAPESQRTVFNADDFMQRNNTELLNGLGNFIHRTMSFTHRYMDGRVPAPGRRAAVDEEFVRLMAQKVERVEALFGSFQFKAALADVMALARAGNVYFDTKAPWKQRKESMDDCGVTINVCLQAVKVLATLMAPFLPFSAARCAQMLSLEVHDAVLPWQDALVELGEGHPLGEPTVLFKKVESVAGLLAG